MQSKKTNFSVVGRKGREGVSSSAWCDTFLSVFVMDYQRGWCRVEICLCFGSFSRATELSFTQSAGEHRSPSHCSELRKGWTDVVAYDIVNAIIWKMMAVPITTCVTLDWWRHLLRDQMPGSYGPVLMLTFFFFFFNNAGDQAPGCTPRLMLDHWSTSPALMLPFYVIWSASQ